LTFIQYWATFAFQTSIIMKIIIIGAAGTIGRKVTAALEKDHDIVRVGASSGDLQADITSPASIEGLFKKVGPFDALISAAGDGHFGPLHTMTDKDFRKGIDSKLMGQINLVLTGQHYIRPKGSFTLTSGSVADDPIRLSASLSAINGALESFGRAAALELDNGVRINVVSPAMVEDSPAYFPFFPGQLPVTMDRVVNAYIRSLLGAGTGQVFGVR
jgi:NAD(P)-dependent dehydrogenase (short-subunit alcohol dehydrogenase family)